MARPRTPSKIVDLRGGFKNHPERKKQRKAEPVPKAGIGPAPAHFTELQSKAWDNLVNIVAPGVLFDSDRAHLEMTARLLAEMWEGPMKTDRMRLLSTLLGKIGLNPSDRSRVQVPDGKGKNPFEGLE